MAFFVNGKFQGVAFESLRAGEYHAALSLFTDSRGASASLLQFSLCPTRSVYPPFHICKLSSQPAVGCRPAVDFAPRAVGPGL